MKEERLKALKRCLNMIQNAHDVLEDVRDECNNSILLA